MRPYHTPTPTPFSPTPAPTPNYGLPGDVNGDGVVDIEDLLAVIDHIFETELLTGEGLAAALALAEDGATVDIEVLLAIIDLIFEG